MGEIQLTHPFKKFIKWDELNNLSFGCIQLKICPLVFVLNITKILNEYYNVRPSAMFCIKKKKMKKTLSLTLKDLTDKHSRRSTSRLLRWVKDGVTLSKGTSESSLKRQKLHFKREE
jgi:hypothetical protein